MQEHSFSIDVDASPREVWEVFWYRGNDRPKNKIGSIDILHPGDDVGNGLVRHCTFPVPRVLLSGGVGVSWEWLTERSEEHTSELQSRPHLVCRLLLEK